LDRISGDWTNFSYNGKEFLDPEHPYSSDLDIFGDKSLFQWINSAHTFMGRKLLAETLSKSEKDEGVVKSRQGAIKELAGKLDFCQDMQSEAMSNKEMNVNPEMLLEYFENRNKAVMGKWMYKLAIIFPAMLIITLLLKLFVPKISLAIPLLIALIQTFILLFGAKRVILKLGEVGAFKDKISVYYRILKIIEGEKFSDPNLNNVKAQLFDNSRAASQALKELGRIVDFVEVRRTMLYPVLGVMLLWDYHCMFFLDKWKSRYGSRVRSWLESVGRMEEIVSLAGISQIHPEAVYPEFNSKGLNVCSENMGHPLISIKNRVSNSIKIRDNICIVTGSNMSGKTTLLRTVGINLVLAYSGAPVCASSFSCSLMDIFTSMRINDDLNGGISTFYAELLRIKKIIDHSKKKQNMIYLIDEIFRGTNSYDRLTGAKSVLRNLNKSWIIGMISTHDLELCDLDKEEGRVKNYYFSEYYENNKILFDYKLRTGKSTTTNAVYLMKMVGIDI
jgi:DNA mismatch repair ATPase MutS